VLGALASNRLGRRFSTPVALLVVASRVGVEKTPPEPVRRAEPGDWVLGGCAGLVVTPVPR